MEDLVIFQRVFYSLFMIRYRNRIHDHMGPEELPNYNNVPEKMDAALGPYN